MSITLIGVQVPSLAPKLDTSFDTMSIEAGVQFLLIKAAIYKGFPIHFDDNRLCGNQKMVAAEPVLIFADEPFNYWSGGCA